MLKNYNHDLVHQLSELSDSLWRFQEYIKNAKECDCCLKVWKELRKDYEKHSKILIEEIKKHCQEGCFE